MANCLKTQLAVSIENNELLRLNALRLSFKKNTFNTAKSQFFNIYFTGDGPVTASVVGDGNIQTSFGQSSWVKTMQLTSGSAVYVSNDDCYIDIYPYENIWRIELGGSGTSGEFYNKDIVNIETLKYTPVVNLLIPETIIPMHLEYLTLPELQSIRMNSCPMVTGELSSLEGKTIGVFHLTGNSKVTGSLDSFLNITPRNGSGDINLSATPNIYKKRSTITALQSAGWTVTVTPEEVDENA